MTAICDWDAALVDRGACKRYAASAAANLDKRLAGEAHP